MSVDAVTSQSRTAMNSPRYASFSGPSVKFNQGVMVRIAVKSPRELGPDARQLVFCRYQRGKLAGCHGSDTEMLKLEMVLSDKMPELYFGHGCCDWHEITVQI